METQPIDLNKLSELFLKLDELTPDEKGKVIDYLVKGLIADTNKAVSIVGKDDPKINAGVVDKAQELVEIISDPLSSDNKQADEVNENIEKIRTEDCAVYIHGNPNGREVVGEDSVNHREYKDPLLKNAYFDRYYSARSGDYNGKERQILARDLGNQSTEYTITKPSYEGRTSREGGYIGLTIVLKNGYKIKDTGKLVAQQIRKNYDGNSSVAEFMNDCMQYLIKRCNLTNGNETANTVKRQSVDKESMRKAVFKIKDVLITSINEDQNFKGWIVKDNS